MSMPKKILYHLTGVIFKMLLVLVPLVFALSSALGSPATIEKALSESKIYDQLVTDALNTSQKEAKDQEAAQLLADQGVRNAITNAFSADVLEQSASSFIQGFYAWLRSDSPELNFSVDLSGAKTKLTQNLAQYAEQRTSKLPVCTVQQLQTIDFTKDLLSLPCLPPGLSPADAGRQFSEQAIRDVEFLQNPIITDETLAKHNDGKKVTDELVGLRSAYQAVETGKWLLLSLLLMLGALLVFARHNKQAGAQHVAWATLGAGAFWVVMLIAYWFFIDKAASGMADESARALLDGMQVVLREFNKVILWFAATYLLLGGAILLIVRNRGLGTNKSGNPK